MQRTFAIPTADGRVCQHFGHCEQFALVDVLDGAVTDIRFMTPPEHQPGLYPRYLAEHGVSVVLAGGMGQKAQNLCQQQGISVRVGVGVDEPRSVVEAYLAGALDTAANQCDHGGGTHPNGCSR